MLFIIACFMCPLGIVAVILAGGFSLLSICLALPGRYTDAMGRR